MSVRQQYRLVCALLIRSPPTYMQVANNVLPGQWDWRGFFVKAGGLLMFAFEKSDAQEKYGQENVFAALMGGRSLRSTGGFLHILLIIV